RNSFPTPLEEVPQMEYTEEEGRIMGMAENVWSGERLQALRKRLGMSQHKLADVSGLSVRSLMNWEQGSREPLASAVVRLAEALGVSTDVLLGVVPMPTDAPGTPADDAEAPAGRASTSTPKTRQQRKRTTGKG